MTSTAIYHRAETMMHLARDKCLGCFAGSLHFVDFVQTLKVQSLHDSL